MMRFWPFALGCLLIAGCGSSDDGHAMRVTNWGGAGDDGPMAKLVLAKNAEFERQAQAKVKIEGIPSEYVPKMLLNFAAGTQPDVMVVDASSAAVFVKNDMLQDLRPFMAKDPDFHIDDYFPNVVKTFAGDDGAIYAIPNDFTPMVLYFNKDLFDQAGVAYPTDSWTFQDFRTAALKLTRKEGGKTTQYGFSFTNWMPGWCMWLWNNGGEILNPETTVAIGVFDSAKNVETFTFLRDLINRDGAAPSLSQAASMGVDPFVNGNAAMTISGHWSLTDYKNAKNIDWKRLGVAAVPHQTGASNTVLYLSGYGIPKGAKHPDLAWKYVKFWTSQSLQTEYQTSGIAVCARQDVAAERAGVRKAGALDPSQSLESMFLPIIPTGRPPYGSRIPGYDVVEKIGTSAMQSVLNGADVQQTLTDAAHRIDREFAKSK